MKELKFYISALYLSLFSRKFYADLIHNRQIFGVRYLLLLSIIVATPIAMEVKYIFSNIFSAEGISIDDNVDYVFKQLPEISVENGKIKTSAKSNLSVVSKSGAVMVVFDTENKIDDLDNYDGVLVVNEEGIRFKLPNESGVAILMASDIENAFNQYTESTASGNKFNLIKMFSDIKQVLKTPFILIVILASLWFFLRYVFSAIIYSFIVGIFFSVVCKRTSFDFKQCFRVAAFAATPVALLEMISNIFGGGLFSYVSLVYFLTHMIYIHFAVDSYRKIKT